MPKKASTISSKKNSSTLNRPHASQDKRADQYDDPSHNYLQYWQGRDYENASEVVALQRLLKNRRFHHAVDIGGGYGRLCVLLAEYADKVTLAEPSRQQLDIADQFLKEYPAIERRQMQADKLAFKDGSVDLITMIRVMHHLPDPSQEFKEIHRVLNKNGYFILEIANYIHARNRLKLFLRAKRVPTEPVDIRSEKNKRKNEIQFVNHNPKTVINQLAHAGFKVERILSVSNLRSPALKRIVPHQFMVNAEKVLQPTLARSFFGPSVFLLVKKAI